MSITTGQTIQASDFINSSAGAADAGKGVKTNSSGKIDKSFSTTPTTTVFTASGTWTKPSGLKYVEVELVGGGASGAAGPNTSTGEGGAGGAAGGYSRKRIDASALGATETVTVGAGGAPSGNVGGTTSFGTHLQATGGGGSGSNGGIGSGGDFNTTGGPGHWGTSNAGSGGDGGDSLLGAGGKGSTFYTVAPSDGQGYGGGGGGRAARNGTNGNPGGSGKAGIVIVQEFYF